MVFFDAIRILRYLTHGARLATIAFGLPCEITPTL
jgi:hypothetical protein